MTATSSGTDIRDRRVMSGPKLHSRAWLITGLLFVFMLLNFADKAVLGLAAGPLIKDFKLTAGEYGHVASSFYFLFSVSALLVGFIANRIATRWVLGVLAVIWALVQFPVGFTTSFGVLVASRIALGAAEGPAYSTANHALQKWFKNEDRQLPSSVLAMGASVGVIAAAPGLTWVIVNFGWRAAFIVLGVLGLIWVAAWQLLGSEGSVGDDASLAIEVEQVETPHVPYWKIFTSGTWLGTVLISFASYWGLALLVAWLPRYLEKGLGYSVTTTGYLVTLPWALSGVMILVGGFVSQRMMNAGVSSRWARGMLSSVVVIVGGVLTFVFTRIGGGALQIIVLTLAFGLAGITFALASTLQGEITPVRQRGAVLGAGLAVATIAGIFAPTVMGNLVQAAASPAAGYQQGFDVAGLLLLIGGVIGALVIRPGKDTRRLLARDGA